MKKAEDFCLEMNWTYDGDPGRFNLFKGLIEPIVKKAQEDAIMETVKECISNIRIRWEYVNNQGWRPTIDTEYVSLTADKLIKEL